MGIVGSVIGGAITIVVYEGIVYLWTRGPRERQRLINVLERELTTGDRVGYVKSQSGGISIWTERLDERNWYWNGMTGMHHRSWTHEYANGTTTSTDNMTGRTYLTTNPDFEEGNFSEFRFTYSSQFGSRNYAGNRFGNPIPPVNRGWRLTYGWTQDNNVSYKLISLHEDTAFNSSPLNAGPNIKKRYKVTVSYQLADVRTEWSGRHETPREPEERRFKFSTVQPEVREGIDLCESGTLMWIGPTASGHYTRRWGYEIGEDGVDWRVITRGQ